MKRPIFQPSYFPNGGFLTDPYPKVNSSLSYFEQETLPHKAVLYQSAYSLLRCRGEAEDAVQETYLQAWKSFHSFQAGTNCRAWLFSILFNVVRRERRKWTYRFYLTNEPAVFETGACLTLPPYDRLTDPEILSALNRLPRPYAEAVVLSDVAELSYKEISDAMSCPIGTVMSRVSRGRELLRGMLMQSASRQGIRRANRDA